MQRSTSDWGYVQRAAEKAAGLGEARSHLDWFLRDPSYVHVPKEHRTAGVKGVMLLRSDQPAGAYRRAGADEFCLHLLLTDGAPARVEQGVAFSCKSVVGGLALTPRDVDLGYEMDADLSFMTAILPHRSLREMVEARTGRSWSGDFGPLHGCIFENQVARALMLALWEAGTQGSPHQSLLADSMIETLALALVCASGLPLASRASPRGGLAPWQVKRVTEYLSAHLGEDVTLSELAGIAHLSPAHFCRAFKQSTGRSPVQQLIVMRIERAKSLLSDPRLPIIEVAASCGYESPSRFAQVFKREIGVTPSEWRRRI